MDNNYQDTNQLVCPTGMKKCVTCSFKRQKLLCTLTKKENGKKSDWHFVEKTTKKHNNKTNKQKTPNLCLMEDMVIITIWYHIKKTKKRLSGTWIVRGTLFHREKRHQWTSFYNTEKFTPLCKINSTSCLSDFNWTKTPKWEFWHCRSSIDNHFCGHQILEQLVFLTGKKYDGSLGLIKAEFHTCFRSFSPLFMQKTESWRLW